MVVVYALAYSIIFIISLIGNALVVSVVMIKPGMRSVTNLFIANLAIADILVAVFCIPITLLDNIFSGKQIMKTITQTTTTKNKFLKRQKKPKRQKNSPSTFLPQNRPDEPLKKMKQKEN